MTERPLSGVRVVVTRPERQAQPLVDALVELGAEVSAIPLVEIEDVPLPTGIDPDSYDWIVLTSANGVAACNEILRSAVGARVAVVGPATAAAVRALGVEPAFVPETFSADAIAGGLEPLAGERVLVAQADLAGPSLIEELRAHGAAVDAVVAYRTLQKEPSAEERAALERAEVIVLASGSAARALAASGAAGERALVVCIGPKTAAVATEVGLTVGLIADEATADGIIRVLQAHLGEST